MIPPLLSLFSLLFLFLLLQASPSHAGTWGTFRSNLYFGLRQRSPAGVSFSLAWFGTDGKESMLSLPIRHACEQGHLDPSAFGWAFHDGRSAGRETVVDPLLNVKFEFEFVVSDGVSSGRGGNASTVGGGNSWGVRIKAEKIDPLKLAQVSLVPYFTKDSSGGGLQVRRIIAGEEAGEVQVSGDDAGRPFTARILDHPDNVYTPKSDASETGTRFTALAVSSDALWQIPDQIKRAFQELFSKLSQKDLHLTNAATAYQLNNRASTSTGVHANLILLQKSLQVPFQVDVFYQDEREGEERPGGMITEQNFAAIIQTKAALFRNKFESIFQLSRKGFDTPHVEFAQSVMSSLLGGIGYFYGTSLVDRNFVEPWDDNSGTVERSSEVKPPAELFTATPSRSFFPRGFYWDEGFHQLLIGPWDTSLSLKMLQSWISLIDDEGWVAREQILGGEARSKVPEKFRVQFTHHANPPTISMAVLSLIRRLESSGDFLTEQLGLGDSLNEQTRERMEQITRTKQVFSDLYPILRKHYMWFRSTQRGQLREWGRRPTSRTESYRWRGRDADHVLTSGLDDYPRAEQPHAGELHLDLACWMAAFSETMFKVAEFIGEETDTDLFAKHRKSIVANIEDLHWNEEKKMYCDVTVDETTDESVFVCHEGYISLFPLLLGIIPPESTHLEHVLDLMSDPDKLMSPFGLRSLSKTHQLFGSGENYWRGPIWIHMNYMALRSLAQKYVSVPGPNERKASKLYQALRNNVIETVYSNYNSSGVLYEQYDENTGAGRKSKSFTGWTSLITLIMGENFY